MNNKTYLVGSFILILIIGYWYLGKSKPTTNSPKAARIISADAANYKQNNGEFLGEKGNLVAITNNQIQIPTTGFETNKTRYFNTELDGKIIYFFVVKDKNGIYHAAANACVVCFKTYKGFRQEGDEIVCNNCGNRYPIEKIATEKGGCNPGPINPNLEVTDGQIIIKQTDIDQVSDLF